MVSRFPASFLARQVRAALAPLREKHFLSRLFALPKSETSMVPLRPCGERRDYRDLLMIHNKRIGRKINNRVAKAVTTATHGCPLPILIATAIPMATAIANIARVITAMRKIARISLNHFGTAEHSRSVGRFCALNKSYYLSEIFL